MDFAYTITTSRTVADVLAAAQSALSQQGFRVLCVHDVRATLADKGINIEPMQLIEFCNAKAAYAVLQADPQASLCLPCKISVYARDNNTVVTAMRPQAITQFFPHINLGALGEELDAKIKAIVDSLK